MTSISIIIVCINVWTKHLRYTCSTYYTACTCRYGELSYTQHYDDISTFNIEIGDILTDHEVYIDRIVHSMTICKMILILNSFLGKKALKIIQYPFDIDMHIKDDN